MPRRNLKAIFTGRKPYGPHIASTTNGGIAHVRQGTVNRRHSRYSRRGTGMMEFGPSIDNPILQLAVSMGESSIRNACEMAENLTLHAEMENSPDGADCVRVTIRSHDAIAGFCMLLKKY